MALLMQNVSTPEQMFLRTLHAYFPTYLFWSSGNCLALIFNELYFRCVYFIHFLLLLYVSRGWRFSFLDNCIAMRFSYDGNYDKAVESGLIVSLEEISLILRHRHSLRRAPKFRPMLGAYGLWEGRDLHRATPVIRGLGLWPHPKDHRLEKTVDTVDVI